MKYILAAFALPWFAGQILGDISAWLTGRATLPMIEDEDFRFHGG